jgi:hypothetical protein
VTYQATAGAGAFAPDLVALRNQRLIDTVLGSGQKSGYDFAIVEQSGVSAAAVYGVYAFPSTTTGVSQSGTRRFATTHVGIMHGDTDLTALPDTIAVIDGIPVLGN